MSLNTSNKTIKAIEFSNSSFTEEGALAIAQSLSTNNTLQSLRIESDQFSMASRKALRNAWSMNNVEGREPEIIFEN